MLSRKNKKRFLESQGKFERLKKLNIITEREKLLSADGGNFPVIERNYVNEPRQMVEEIPQIS